MAFRQGPVAVSFKLLVGFHIKQIEEETAIKRWRSKQAISSKTGSEMTVFWPA
ncbi:hypothetical protein DY000_02060848 [Brassica cretica]|uniref:Uncharacterized protein n=1 Tax=Brassica cretica TaxID=69181 RepID=A0ABQ7B441_BRACR|nr:hypothetical protein DY000_02060848 [Brassica cretica]